MLVIVGKEQRLIQLSVVDLYYLKVLDKAQFSNQFCLIFF